MEWRGCGPLCTKIHRVAARYRSGVTVPPASRPNRTRRRLTAPVDGYRFRADDDCRPDRRRRKRVGYPDVRTALGHRFGGFAARGCRFGEPWGGARYLRGPDLRVLGVSPGSYAIRVTRIGDTGTYVVVVGETAPASIGALTKNALAPSRFTFHAWDHVLRAIAGALDLPYVA